MSRYWNILCVKNKTQDEIKQLIITEIESATEGNLTYQASYDAPYRLKKGRQELIGITAKVNEWVGVLGMHNRVMVHLMEKGQLSGIIVESEDEPGNPMIDNWSYMLWEQGQLVDWHVSNPKGFFFETWADESLEAYVLPWLQAHTAQKNLTSISLRSFLSSNPKAMKGNPDTLIRFTGSRFDRLSIDEWLDLRAGEAFPKASEILGIPLVSFGYDLLAIETYFDVKRGKRPDPRKNPSTDTVAYDLYQWAVDHVAQLDEMILLPFQWTEQYRSIFSINPYHFFFYWW